MLNINNQSKFINTTNLIIFNIYLSISNKKKNRMSIDYHNIFTFYSN